MRKFLYVFGFCTTLWVATYSQFPLPPGICSKQSPKISFSGKAPWSIDGKIDDWITLLGSSPGGGFSLPAAAAFNWVNDLRLTQSDGETPKPESDMDFLAFTHDDYNVYYYLRRRKNGSSANTFYYFLDVNGDAVMNLGEPVIHASFTNKTISPLTLGLYVPNKDTGYSQQKKGNWLGVGDFGGAGVQNVNRHAMPGDIFDVLNSDFVFFPIALRRNEIFKVKLTEDGYGLELAIPWRYLRNWLTLKDPLDPGDIFFYKVSMQEGSGRYNPQKVVDNAGSCYGGPGISGNPKLAKSLTTTIMVPGSVYKFNLEYTNLTNAATEVGLERINLDFAIQSGLPITTSDFATTVYADSNCNGVVDANEIAVNYWTSPSIPDSCCHLYFLPGRPLGLPPPGPEVVLPPFGKGCYIIYLTLPSEQAIRKFKISFITSVLFVEGREPCEPGCGSKPINPVGYMETEVSSDLVLSAAEQKRNMTTTPELPAKLDVILYPNPSRGITNLVLPQSGDITVIDNLGRSIQTITKAQAGIIQLKGLKPGFYIVKMRAAETGKVTTKKLVIQP